MAEDTEMTPEEDAALKAQETGELAPVESAEPEEGRAVADVYPEPGTQARRKHEEAVPFERFDQLNQRLAAAEQQLSQANEYRERWARLEERQKQAAEAQAAARAAVEAAERAKARPDPELDPSGARSWDAEQRAIRAEQQVAWMSQQLGQFAQGQQVQNANYDMQNWLAFQVPQARMRFPDYDTRVDFARAARA
ncbi:MAG: hypothetical protein HRJ53_25810, partial [Acidobacteria bacterium Pan2503]|nr:hypothetical protein [Candidatus Acidoferrum panamensis]